MIFPLTLGLFPGHRSSSLRPGCRHFISACTEPPPMRTCSVSNGLGAINVNLAEVTQAGGMSNDNDIEAAELLSQFAESLVHRDLDESARLRSGNHLRAW